MQHCPQSLKTENRKQKAENKQQKMENKEQKIEIRNQKIQKYDREQLIVQHKLNMQ